MAASGWAFRTARDLARALAAKKVSALELAEDAISRIERHDGRINAVCVRDFDRARQAARAADRTIAQGLAGPLTGIPMTVKESFHVAGLATTWGFAAHRNFISTEDALAISRVKAAGAVILGKTNVPAGLADWQSYNDIYGVTRNPFDLARTPGGSSGGSSAALAAGFGALSLGSDIGGSLRAPAHFCGVYAHKPTHALVPSRGHSPPPFPALAMDRDLSVVGPMARSAADLVDLLEVMAGPDELTMGRGYRLALPRARRDSLAAFRVFVLDTHPLMPVDASVRAAIDRLAERLAAAGAKVARRSDRLPDFEGGTRLYMKLLLSLLAATFPPEAYEAMKAAAARLEPGDRTLAAERLRGAVASHREWVEWDRQRALLRAQWRSFFEDFDVLLCPIMPTPAYPHDATPDQDLRRITIDGRDYPYGDQLAWPGIATCPGLPATAVPLGLAPGGLPVGAQIVGPWLEDRTPLRLAELLEQAFGGFVPPPGID